MHIIWCFGDSADTRITVSSWETTVTDAVEVGIEFHSGRKVKLNIGSRTGTYAWSWPWIYSQSDVISSWIVRHNSVGLVVGGITDIVQETMVILSDEIWPAMEHVRTRWKCCYDGLCINVHIYSEICYRIFHSSKGYGDNSALKDGSHRSDCEVWGWIISVGWLVCEWLEVDEGWTISDCHLGCLHSDFIACFDRFRHGEGHFEVLFKTLHELAWLLIGHVVGDASGYTQVKCNSVEIIHALIGLEWRQWVEVSGVDGDIALGNLERIWYLCNLNDELPISQKGFLKNCKEYVGALHLVEGYLRCLV